MDERTDRFTMYSALHSQLKLVSDLNLVVANSKNTTPCLKKFELFSANFRLINSDSCVIFDTFFSGRVRSWRHFLGLWCMSDFGGISSINRSFLFCNVA